MPMIARIVVALAIAVSACRSAPVGGESANLARAKQLVDATAADLDQLAARVDGADAAQKRAAGERLRRSLESRRTDGEALQKLLTDEEKQRLREYGARKLRPAVLALEKKLGSAAAVPAADPATPAGR